MPTTYYGIGSNHEHLPVPGAHDSSPRARVPHLARCSPVFRAEAIDSGFDDGSRPVLSTTGSVPSCSVFIVSLVWLTDPPAPVEMVRYYGPEYDRFIRKAKETHSPEHRQGAVETEQRYREGGRLLDLGCGSGRSCTACALERETFGGSRCQVKRPRGA